MGVNLEINDLFGVFRLIKIIVEWCAFNGLNFGNIRGDYRILRN